MISWGTIIKNKKCDEVNYDDYFYIGKCTFYTYTISKEDYNNLLKVIIKDLLDHKVDVFHTFFGNNLKWLNYDLYEILMDLDYQKILIIYVS